MNTALKTEIGTSQFLLSGSYNIRQHEEDSLTSCDPFDGLVVPLEARDIVLDPHTGFELALEKVAFVQE